MSHNRLVLKDVVFIAPRLGKAVPKFDTKGADVTEREFVTRVLITKAQAKQYKKDHPKATTKVKTMDKEDFDKAFGIKVDDKFLNSDDEYMLLSFNRPAGYPDKTERTPPKVHALKGTGIKLANKIVGTGSEGHLQLSERSAREKMKLDIEAVYLSKLVAYVPQETTLFEVEDEEEGVTTTDAGFEVEDNDNEPPFEADSAEEQVDDWDE